MTHVLSMRHRRGKCDKSLMVICYCKITHKTTQSLLACFESCAFDPINNLDETELSSSHLPIFYIRVDKRRSSSYSLLIYEYNWFPVVGS
jgi:hypothetical protein